MTLVGLLIKMAIITFIVIYGIIAYYKYLENKTINITYLYESIAAVVILVIISILDAS